MFDDGIKLCVAGHSPLDVDYRVVWAEGTQHRLHTRGNATIDAQGVASRILALSQDVSARKGADDQVRFIAHHDALTGLPNRALLRDRFQLALNGARRNRNRLALIFIDLDHFKDINDALGHEGGDALLVSVAERMRAAVRDTDTICRQSGDEFIALLPALRVAVNVSPVQLRQRSIIEKVASALHDHGLDGGSLELELTERALIHNADSVGALLADFRSEGIRLALDDFGTGYSSLSCLHRFPVDKLKIDRSFVAASPGDASAAAIVRAVINLAQSLGLDIVAEGAETAGQLAFLQASGCAAFQGFLSGPVGTSDDLPRHAQAFREARSVAMAMA